MTVAARAAATVPRKIWEITCCKFIGIQCPTFATKNHAMQVTKIKYRMNKGQIDTIAPHILVCVRPNMTVAEVAVPVKELGER